MQPRATLTEKPIKPVRQRKDFHSGWNLQEYMEHNINMAFGEPSLITFIAIKNTIPDIIAAFGKGVSFYVRKDGNYDCTVRISLYNMEKRAMQNRNRIIITNPPELVQAGDIHLQHLQKRRGKNAGAV